MKPTLWLHKFSGRIRFHGDDLPDSWIPLYAKEEPELSIPVATHLDLPEKTERIWNYVKDRKAMFEVTVVAQQFQMRHSSASKHLATLYGKGLLTRIRKGSKVMWGVAKEPKHEEPETKAQPEAATPSVPVAVSPKPAKPQPSRPASVVWPDNPFKPSQTSYPNVRGYDD
jgi:DNA-binding transcriptional ArsR family regulator